MFAGALCAAGMAMAKVADQVTPPASPPVTLAKVQTELPSSGRRTFNIARDSRGHFSTDARIDGQRIGVMVDTGASVLALNESSAARIGVRPRPADYTAQVSTANGTIKGAHTRIARIDVGGIVVRDVDALVLPDAALSENLLGLSFLSKLKRFEFAGSRLVLEQ